MSIFEFIEHYYLTLLVLLPLLLLIPLLVIPEGEEGRGIHRYGRLSSLVLFLYSLLPWMGVVNPGNETYRWLPNLGISFALGTDGFSTTLVVLTTFLLVMAVIASLSNIKTRLRFYYSMLLILTTAVLGVFVSRDLFLFFLYWELELIPMYFLIAIWGGPRRDYAAIKFVLYTLFGSVFLVAGFLALYFHASQAGMGENFFMFSAVTQALQLQPMPLATQILIFIALFITFAVKLPVVPLHTWLPDAHVEAPTPISMLLAGILLKMGAYGMLRFCFGMLPEAAHALAPYIALLALINIVYTAGVALVQTDLKKLIAYSSVSHMGFVLLGLAALNAVGFNGAVFVMFSHGLVSAALFMCVGTLYLRTHSRLIADYGGFGSQTPRIFYFFMFMSLASLGLPLLVSFASETLVFYGAFISHAFTEINLFGSVLPWSIQALTLASGLGVIIGAAYLLWMLKRVFFGPIQERWLHLPDASTSEVVVLAALGVLVLVYGVYPKFITRYFEGAVTRLASPYENLSPSAAEAPGRISTPVLTATLTGARQ